MIRTDGKIAIDAAANDDSVTVINGVVGVSTTRSLTTDEKYVVTENHQNIIKSTCHAGNGYEVGDDWKLADWNGATNGGQYNVIFMDIQTTWCPP